MFVRYAMALLVAGLFTSSCDRKSERTRTTLPKEESAEPAEEKERPPREDEVAEDCVAFVRATVVTSADNPQRDCPDCAAAAGAAEILAFQQFQVDKVSCSEETCEIVVTITAAFNQVPPGTVSGGLTAWLSAEQRKGYTEGHPPTGHQAFVVKVVYKRTDRGWRAAEFDRAETR